LLAAGSFCAAAFPERLAGAAVTAGMHADRAMTATNIATSTDCRRRTRRASPHSLQSLVCRRRSARGVAGLSPDFCAIRHAPPALWRCAPGTLGSGGSK
jgi:hypothetical protein